MSEEAKAIIEAIKPAWEHVTEAVKHITAAIAEMVPPISDGIAAVLDADRAIMASATPKERHYILHAKKWRVRKKYYDRVRRRMPENYTDVLIYYERNAYPDGADYPIRKREIGIGFCGGPERWHVDHCNGVDGLAWMPLPEPQKEE